MDSRKALDPGTIRLSDGLGGYKEYYIKCEIGRGGSCIAYDGSYVSNQGVPISVHVKEFYPYKLDIKREPDGNLSVGPSDLAEYESHRERVARSFKKHSELFGMNGLTNYLAVPENIFFANNTIYMVTAYSQGRILTADHDWSVRDIIGMHISLSKTIFRLHQAGYLYLDLKPGNIWILEGQPQLQRLLDFDSILPVNYEDRNAWDYRICFTRGFAPVEQQEGDLRKIGKWSDIYSIGALLFYMLFGRTPSARDCSAYAVYDFSQSICSKAHYSSRLYRNLEEIFHKTLASYYKDRYQNVSELTRKFEEAWQYAAEKTLYAHPSYIAKPPFFIGRRDELERLRQWLFEADSKCLILSGMDGIGKSTLIRRFLTDTENQYDQVFWLLYTDSMEKTLGDDSQLLISSVGKSVEESAGDYYIRKLKALKESLKDENSIFVIDNYQGDFNKAFYSFLSGNWRVIVITRENRDDNDFTHMELPEISDPADLYCFIENHAGCPVTEENAAYVNNIIEKTYRNTLLLELISRQIGKSYLSFKQMSDILDQTGLFHLRKEKIHYVKDTEVFHDTFASVITRIFTIDSMDSARQNILRIVAVLSVPVIPVSDLKYLYPEISLDVLNDLKDEGWLKGGHNIEMHPLIRETVIQNEWLAEARSLLMTVFPRILDYLKKNGKAGIYPLQDSPGSFIGSLPKGSSPVRQFFLKNSLASDDLSSLELKDIVMTPSASGEMWKELYRFVRYGMACLEFSASHNVLYKSDLYFALEYAVLMNLPADEEELSVIYAKELIDDSGTDDDYIYFKIAERLTDLLTNREEYREAKIYIEKFRTFAAFCDTAFAWGRFYDILSWYFDCRIGGRYYLAAENKMLMKAIDQSIEYMGKSSRPEARKYYGKYLLDKANVLMRTSRPGRRRSIRLLMEAKEAFESRGNVSAQDVFSYYMVCARYYTSVSRNRDSASYYIQKAMESAGQSQMAPIEIINQIIIPAADMLLELEDEKGSEALLLHALSICGQMEQLLPYQRRRNDLYKCLLDMYIQMGDREKARKIEQIINESAY